MKKSVFQFWLFLPLVLTAFSFSAHAENFDWSGYYVGINAGVGRAYSQTTENRYSGVTYNYSAGSATSNDYLVGVQFGGDLQRESWVIGLQGMWDPSDMNSDHPYINGVTPGDRAFCETSQLTTLNGRAGYLLSPATMVYAKVGWAWAKTKFVDKDTGLYLFRVEQRRDGPIVGLGTECRFAKNFSIFAEYSYIQFGKESAHPKLIFGPGSTDYAVTIDQHIETLLVGLNYRFK